MFKKFMAKRIGKLLLGGENGGVKINFLEKVTLMMNMFVMNSVTTTFKVKKASRLQKKKELDANCLGTQAKSTFLHKMRNVSLPDKKKLL